MVARVSRRSCASACVSASAVTPQEIYGTAEGLINMTRLDDDDERLLQSSGTPVCEADEIVVVDDEGTKCRTARPAS